MCLNEDQVSPSRLDENKFGVDIKTHPIRFIETDPRKRIFRVHHYDSLNSKETSYLEHPLYCISTRDSFAYDLIKKVE